MREDSGRYVFRRALKPAIRQQAMVVCPKMDSEIMPPKKLAIKLAQQEYQGRGTWLAVKYRA